jgi:hypothetical protein
MTLFLDVLQVLPVGILICENTTVLFINKQFDVLIHNSAGLTPENSFTRFKSLISTYNRLPEFKINVNDKFLLVQQLHSVENRIIYIITDITVINKLNAAEIEEKFKDKIMQLFMHEFKTPLNWLNGILSSIISSESTKHLLKMAKHATNILNLYIDDSILQQ